MAKKKRTARAQKKLDKTLLDAAHSGTLEQLKSALMTVRNWVQQVRGQ